MKSLSQYILEARETFYLGPKADIDKLQPILQTVSTNGFLDNSEVEYINNLIGKNLSIHALHGIIAALLFSKNGLAKEPFSNISIEDTKKFVQLVEKIPLNRIERMLGGGAEGCIIDLGHDIVMKIFYTDIKPINISWENLFKVFEEMSKQDFETLPKIYRVSSPYLIREALKVNTKKCKDYFNISKKIYRLGNECDDMLIFVSENMENELKAILKTELEIEVLDWLVKLRDEMESLGIDELFGEDFKLSNIGEDRDGNIKCFDF